MPRVSDLIRRSLLSPVPDILPPLDVLQREERCPEFDRLRMNRKIMGAFRYGRMGAEGKPQFDRLACIKRRLAQYEDDGNKEHLVDIANLAELEFVEGRGHFEAQSDGVHTREAE